MPLLAGLAFACAAVAFAGPRVEAQTAGPAAPAQAQAQDQAQNQPVAPAPAPVAAPAPRKKSKNPTGTPLDTLMSTRLHADVPDAKDFVREARPPAETLEFKPTAGTDPERPKLRTKAELDALQSELESAGQRNLARAGRVPLKPPLALAGEQTGSRGAKPPPN